MDRIVVEGADGVRLRGDAVGDEGDPPVILLHGGGQTRWSWQSTLEVLGRSGWRACSFDLRGHGESDWSPDADYAFASFAADVARVAEAVGEQPALVGASLGGLAALLAVGEHLGPRPLARALVLVDVAPRIETEGAERVRAFMQRHVETGFGSLDEVLDAVQEYNPHRPRPADTSGIERNLRRGEDGRWYWHWDPAYMLGRPRAAAEQGLSLERERLQAAARALTVPTLLVRGRMSDILSEEGAREMLELAPHARYVDVADAGHMVAGDRNDAFNAAVVDFLASVRGVG